MGDKEYTLVAQSELRCEIPPKSAIHITLLEGDGEVFGAELVIGKATLFSDVNVAVFTWTGCRIMVSGTTSVAYISNDTPMVIYANIHAAIQQQRNDVAQGGIPPKVMIVGGQDSGKSSLCRILINYAVREAFHPLFVDLDVNEGMISMPGAISFTHFQRPFFPSSVVDNLSVISLNYGHEKVDTNLRFFRKLITKTNEIIVNHDKHAENQGNGGCIINTFSLTKENIVEIAQTLKVTVIIVLDSERLFAELQSSLSTITLIRAPKSGGVVTRDVEERQRQKNTAMMKYFYGHHLEGFIPKRFDVSFDSIRIIKVGAPSVPLSCLPIGSDPTENQTQLVNVELTEELLHSVLGVSSVDDADSNPSSDVIINSTVLGYICVLKVDVDRRSLTVLAPASFPLPRRTLLWTPRIFIES